MIAKPTINSPHRMKFYRINSQVELTALRLIHPFITDDTWDMWLSQLLYHEKITLRIGDSDNDSGYINGHGDYYTRSYMNTEYSCINIFNLYMKHL